MARPTPRWSPARCQFTLIAITALIDRKLTSEEEFEALALGARSMTMHELDLATTQDWLRDVIAQSVNEADVWQRARKAVSDFPQDLSMRRAIYAHCADIAYADRAIAQSERRFMSFLAKELGIPPGERRKIDNVMELKNRH
jgi:hypothetical protein